MEHKKHNTEVKQNVYDALFLAMKVNGDQSSKARLSVNDFSFSLFQCYFYISILLQCSLIFLINFYFNIFSVHSNFSVCFSNFVKYLICYYILYLYFYLAEIYFISVLAILATHLILFQLVGKPIFLNSIEFFI